MVDATGGQIVITSDAIDIQGDIRSWRPVGSTIYRGTLTLQTLSAARAIDVAMGGAVRADAFILDVAELDHIINGFDDGQDSLQWVNGALAVVTGTEGITIGRANGRHDVHIGSYTFCDSVTFRAPVLGGSFEVLGIVRTNDVDTAGNDVKVEYMGAA
jgi:hypothetical protein